MTRQREHRKVEIPTAASFLCGVPMTEWFHRPNKRQTLRDLAANEIAKKIWQGDSRLHREVQNDQALSDAMAVARASANHTRPALQHFMSIDEQDIGLPDLYPPRYQMWASSQAVGWTRDWVSTFRMSPAQLDEYFWDEGFMPLGLSFALQKHLWRKFRSLPLDEQDLMGKPISSGRHPSRRDY